MALKSIDVLEVVTGLSLSAHNVCH